ncbi:MAG: HmuY family protein [Bacteroidia bacterium]|nr:HmuY family protein [Bacteroidia bacterium]
MKDKIIFIALSTLLLLTSCFKEDRPLVLPASKAKVMSVFMGSEFQNQIFFKMEDQSYQTSNLNDWDLAFDNVSNQFKIVTNYGRNIFVARTQALDVSQLESIKPAQIPIKQWLYDFPNGSIDSNAFGDWKNLYGNKMPFHIIDMGRTLPSPQRYYVVRVLEADDVQYKVEFGKFSMLDSLQVVEIKRNKNRNFTYLNIRNGQIHTDFEPLKEDWDFVFTRYRFIFYIDPNPTEPLPYLVSGCLLNPHNVSVSLDTVSGFENINLKLCNQKHFTKSQDVIGYAWKSFDYSVSFSYTINPNMVYIVKNNKGDFYKIRFLDFYNENKQTGYPKFQIQQVVN